MVVGNMYGGGGGIVCVVLVCVLRGVLTRLVCLMCVFMLGGAS